MTETVLETKCPICGNLGIIKQVELLPKTGIAMECDHQDGNIHRWAEYNSMEAIEKNNVRKNGTDPNIIKCPKCGKRGRVNEYHEDKKRPNKVNYVIVHEEIGGTWGRKGTVKKRRRCYITDKIMRDKVLKKLGRYIKKEKL